MGYITWANSVTCKECITQIYGVSKTRLYKIVQERKKCKKCAGCERLREVEKRLEK